MKIIIFEPHPDDLLFGPGPILLGWIKEGHDIHVITVTDGRACFRDRKGEYAPEVATMTEDDVAEMRLQEARNVFEFLGLPQDHLHLLKFHDAEGQKYVKEAIEKVKLLLSEIDRIVLPSNNNLHIDHQATRDIAIGAAKELELKRIEYFVYFVPSYGKFREDSKEKQIEFPISEELRQKLFDWLDIYKSQKMTKWTGKLYNRFIRKLQSMTYGLFSWEDIGKYYNF